MDNNTFYINAMSENLYNRYELFFVPLINSIYYNYNKFDNDNARTILHNYLFLRLHLYCQF